MYVYAKQTKVILKWFWIVIPIVKTDDIVISSVLTFFIIQFIIEDMKSNFFKSL